MVLISYVRVQPFDELERVGEERNRVDGNGLDLVGEIEARFQYGFQALDKGGRKAFHSKGVTGSH